MADGDTKQLRDWVRRMRGADESALNELLEHFQGRLIGLTHKMLDSFPGARRWDQTGDVYQRAALRLIAALKGDPRDTKKKKVDPQNTAEFFGLAARQIRFELLDLAASAKRLEGSSRVAGFGSDGDWSPSDSAEGPDTLAEWTEFHEKVGALPDELRAVFEQTWYNGLNRSEVAELLGLDPRTVEKRYQKACLKLDAALGGRFPGR